MRQLLVLLLIAFLSMSPVAAQGEIEVVTVSWPKPYAISTNIVFVVDASSTIERHEGAKRKFTAGWEFITRQFAADELFFRAYVFHDIYSERKTKWVNAGGPDGLKQFGRAKSWIRKNTGIYSWGLKALRMALREKNPLDKNDATARRLTIVLFTDGGLTEAANGNAEGELVLNSTLKRHVYSRHGDYKVVNTTIEQEQIAREMRGDERATIVTVGVENIWADNNYGTSVKRPDAECQDWLRKLGEKYNGGYFYVRTRKQ